jgi:hypothetical protein
VPDSLQRSASILLGLAVLLVIGWLTFEQLSVDRPRATPEADASAEVDAGAEVDAEDAGEDLALLEELDGDLPVAFEADASALPQGAPRSVRLGVVLVQFAGAEGAPPTARSKREASALANKLADDAKANFRHAVLTADPGSSEDIGRIPRGVLDPRTELAVFSLAPGTVSDALETPRGYWIVKRID